MRRLKADNPAIKKLLDQPELAANELALRLYYRYRSQDESLLSAAQEASLAAAGGGAASGGQGEEGLPEEERVAPVPPELHVQLGYFRALACFPYDYNTGAPICSAGRQPVRGGSLASLEA